MTAIRQSPLLGPGQNGYKRKVHFDPSSLSFAVDARGAPVAGRRAEARALFEAGYRNLSYGRLFEGHVNALQLVGRLGTAAQRERARADAAAGKLFGVWNTQDRDGVKIVEHGGRRVLRGRKTFASGVGTVARGLISAALPNGGGTQLLLLRMDEIAVLVDRFSWRPLGMEASESFSVSFDDVEVDDPDVLGLPNVYEREPWFVGGSLRYVAVQTGGLARLHDEMLRYLNALGRAGSPFMQIRIAEATLAVESAKRWVEAGVERWSAFDEAPTEERAQAILETADLARVAVERAAFDLIERVEKSVGARGLLEPEPFAGLIKDLTMYVRQPAPDATLVRIAERASAANAAATNLATGTDSGLH